MDGPPTVEATHQLEELILAVDDLRRRVAALEQSAVSSTLPHAAAAVTIRETHAAAAEEIQGGLIAAVGRAFLGIAGAFLLRAVTESGILPQLAGILLGLAYAGAWLAFLLASKVANRLTILLHGLTACLIACPLLWEATVRFHALTPSGAAIALVLFVTLGQAVAWRHGLQSIGGVTAAAGSITAIGLISATLDPQAFALAMVALAAVVEAGAIFDRAAGLRWVTALGADLSVLVLVYVATRPQGLPEGYTPLPVGAVIAIPAALMIVYLTSLVARTLVRRMPFAWFEIAQAAAVVALAMDAAFRSAHAEGVVGAIALAAGAACYLAAFAGTPGRIPRNFHVYTAYAAILIILGSALALPDSWQGAVWLSAGLAAVWLGERNRWNTFRLHGALYLTGAALASGLLAAASARMIGTAGQAWPTLTVGRLLSLAAVAIACAMILRLRRGLDLPWQERIAAAMVAALLCFSISSILAGGLIDHRLDAPLASTVRTAIVVLVALALAWFGGRSPFPELIWLLYPWMIMGGVKLILEDYRHGVSATLFLSLLLYGGTLIALPRLLRMARRTQ